MSLDITRIIEGWPYNPGEVTVRKIRGDDGSDKIQLRMDLGLLQMEVAGRPDGQCPHECESLLEYYEGRLQDHVRREGDDEAFVLDEEACELLRSEGIMYYHRYLAEFVLEDYAAVERDTTRNLRLLDFLADYAEDPSDRLSFEQYRPYIIMMRTRARAQLALQGDQPRRALDAVKEGIDLISEFYRDQHQEKMLSKSGELAVLRTFARELEALLPADPTQRIKRELDRAVREERYEDAATLRDELSRMDRSPRDGAERL